MKTQTRNRAPLGLILCLASLGALGAGYDCQYCWTKTNEKDELGYPACQIVTWAPGQPACVIVPDETTLEEAKKLPQRCIWPAGLSISTHWQLFQGNPIDESQSCGNNYDLVGEDDAEFPACDSQGTCVIEV